MSRYSGRRKLLNNPFTGDAESIYQEFLDNRNIRQLTQYASPSFPKLTAARRGSILYDNHIWKTGDRFYKLAYEYYGNSELWWIIAWYNQTPTESHVNLGDTIMVPVNSERVLTYFSQ
jgi:hypothetical protein